MAPILDGCPGSSRGSGWTRSQPRREAPTSAPPERHLDVAERYLYPMVVRLRPDIGEDIVRYPDHHERHARRLIDQLRIAPEALSLMLLDDITVDIHRTIVELERRVLPELQRHLDERQRGRLLDAEFTELQ